MKREWIVRVLFVVFGAVFLVSAGQLLYYLREYRKGESEYEQIARSAVRAAQESGADPGPEEKAYPAGETEAAEAAEETPEGPELEIDFGILSQSNPDTVAWIDFPGQDISYPVVRGSDNEYYLTHTFAGTRNSSGSIFLDFRNTDLMLPGGCTVIYGHNMKNGSMFGQLKKYREKSHLESFPFFDVYTPEAAYRCRIVMAGNVRDSTEFYPVSFADGGERSRYLDLMKEHSWYEIPDAGDGGEELPLVLLSTCTGGDHAYRFVLLGQAVRQGDDAGEAGPPDP